MEDPGFRARSKGLRRLHAKLKQLLDQTDTRLEALSSEAPTAESIGRLERLRAELTDLVRDYLAENAAILDAAREQASKIEEARQRAAMSEKSPRQPKDQARIQELSEQLTRDLRLERIDNAIKELLDFLSDAEFFAENASTGRRRRLRSLQNAIEKALQK